MSTRETPRRANAPASQATLGLHAIVLCKQVTGYATVRALARQGVSVHAVVFEEQDPVLGSKYPASLTRVPPTLDDASLVALLRTLAQGLPARPAVIPTCDRNALFLARQRDALADCCAIWETASPLLDRIIDKQGLYALAAERDVPVIAWHACSDLPSLQAWLAQHPGPYLMKPGYCGQDGVALTDKNRVFDTPASMLDFLAGRSPQGLVVQRLLQGGDGEIFDTYGYCDRHGQVRTISTHRRWRQHPPNLGTTTYGEIPALPGSGDEAMVRKTHRLLQGLGYHGIFGIEWLRDRDTGRFHVLDFNARPFSSIGHLVDCGVNLPWIACRELLGDTLDDVERRPDVTPKLWVDLSRDVQSRARLSPSERSSTWSWVRSLLATQSWAYFDIADPWPALWMSRKVLSVMVRPWMWLSTHPLTPQAEPVGATRPKKVASTPAAGAPQPRT